MPADRNGSIWIFEIIIDQLSITAQEQAFQSAHSLYFQVLYCFSDLQTAELFIPSLVLKTKTWSSNCFNYQVFLPYMWPIIKLSKPWSSTANQHSYKALSAAAQYFSTSFFFSPPRWWKTSLLQYFWLHEIQFLGCQTTFGWSSI